MLFLQHTTLLSTTYYRLSSNVDRVAIAVILLDWGLFGAPVGFKFDVDLD